MENQKSGVVLLLSDSLGVFIPQYFCTNFHLIFSNADTMPGWKGIGEYENRTCLAGPDDPDYWESWDSILTNATHVDADGNEWRLYQDGNLWAICPEIMSTDEKHNFGFEEY